MKGYQKKQGPVNASIEVLDVESLVESLVELASEGLLADNLAYRYPKAADSPQGGLEETLTVHHLKLPGLLRQTLSSTNAMKSANSGWESSAACATSKTARGPFATPLPASWKRSAASDGLKATSRFPSCKPRWRS